MTVLEGNNGIGKTNILEALTILSVTKSPRSSKDDQLIQNDFKVGRIYADFTDGERQKRVLLAIDNSTGRVKKFWRLQGVPKRPTDIIGALQVILFRPDDLNLLIVSPGERRNYLDLIIARRQKGYLPGLSRFKKILAQRRAALEIMRTGGSAGIEALNTQLIELGSIISLRRGQLLEKINPLYKMALKKINVKSEGSLQIINPLWPSKSPKSIAGYRAAYGQAIAKNINREIMAARNLVGPQREDLQVLLDGRLLRDFGSRGEWRSGILALKKSEADLIEQSSGSRPVLLLDDVASELDNLRQKSLVDWIRGQQTILSTTSLSSLPKALQKNIKLIKVGGQANTINTKKYALA